MNFYQTITAAINDISVHGYDDPSRIEGWTLRIAEAARKQMLSETKIRETLDRTFGSIYNTMVGKGQLIKLHNGVSRFTLEKIKPKLRAELDRRIMASADLIKLNRKASIEKTIQRFSGWATSVPKGGSRAVEKPEVKDNLRKALAQLPFEERRVIIDQGHKFTAALNNIVAVDGGAIAVKWHSRFRVPGYNYREDHKERDGHIYLIRGNWASEKGLVKPGPDGYYDEITQVAEEPFCRCSATFEYALRDLPDNMLTKKGADELARMRSLIAGSK